ncbi:MAG TPA: YgjV family protein [Ferruginibacter sp.]|nr:YgjV family protein [Ferruginibacter sp.]HPH91547.1 YgjV family protein [Ferruginibacter sp.]
MLQQITPYFGYLASLCLIIALLVNNDLKFRWFNTFGNIFFIVYALVLNAVPVLITNVLLLGINAYYLFKVYRRQENFDMLSFKGDEKMAQKFIRFYQGDIASYFPSFTPSVLQDNFNFVVTRDLVIANMFSAKVLANGDAVVALNYTLQKYRDYKVGTYIFEKEKDFMIANGVKRIVYTDVPNKNHRRFLKVMGFEETLIGEKNCFAKLIAA